MSPGPGAPLSRRDLLRLAAAGSAAWLLPACPPAGPSRPAGSATGSIPGAVLGQDDRLGHLLRSGALAGRAPDEEADEQVAIVGAGVAGLACAWRLRHGGVTDVLVVDAGREPGGNARGGRNEVSAYPWGAHYLRAPTPEHRALERFLEEVGLIRGRDARGELDWDTRAVCRAPQERLHEGGLWGQGLFPPPRSGDADDEAEWARFQERLAALAAFRDGEGRRAFALPLELSSRDPELLALDRLSFAAWLDSQGFTRPAVRWLCEYACRDDYGCTLETTSAWAGLHYFVARRADDPGRAVTLTWPEGNARLVQLLLEAARPRVQARTLCCALAPGEAPGQPSGATLYRADADRLVRLRARHLVWAGPRFQLPRLLGRPLPGAEAFTYAPWLVANLTLASPPGGVGAPLAWDNVLYGSPSLGYVVANRDAPPDAPCVVTWYEPLVHADPAKAREELLALDQPAIAARVLGDLARAHPALPSTVQRLDAWRWGHAMIRPVPGFVWGPDRQAARAPVGALRSCNADLSGIPVFEEAFYQGVRAAEEVLGDMGREVETFL